MNYINNQPNLTETFIIEPAAFTAETFDTLTACTAVYTDALISCSENTSIFLGNGVINFNGNIYTNNSVSANTVYASTYYSGGTNLLDIVKQYGTSLTGGTFNNTTDTLSLFNSNGSTVFVTGFTDYYTTGTTIIGNTVYFNRNDQLSAYTLNLSGITSDKYTTGVTFSNDILVIGRNDGVNLSTYINYFVNLTAATSISTNLLKSLSGNSQIELLSNEITVNTNLNPKTDNTTDLGTPIKRFRQLNTFSGNSTYWYSQTAMIPTLTAYTVDLGNDAQNDHRILTADSSILVNDGLRGGTY